MTAPAERPLCVVPSDRWPTLASVVGRSPLGAVVEVLAGYSETVEETLVLDRPFEIEGPADCSATLILEQGAVCAMSSESDSGGVLALRNLVLRSSQAPTVVVAGPCAIEFCDISGAGMGVQVVAPSGDGPAISLTQNTVHGCDVGLCLAGGLWAPLAGNRVTGNSRGIVVIGLDVREGDNVHALAALAGVSFSGNSEADVELQSLRLWQRTLGNHLEGLSAVPIRRFGACGESVELDTVPGVTFVLQVNGTTVRAALCGAQGVGSGVARLPTLGRWITAPLPADGAGLRERRRDFARLTAPEGSRALLVVSPGLSPPTCWTRPEPDGQEQPANLAVDGIHAWLEQALAEAAECRAAANTEMPDKGPLQMQPGLKDRCLSLLGAGEGVAFATLFGLTPALLQPHFVLLVSTAGEVRVAWFVFVTDDARPSPTSAVRLLRLVTDDLNSLDVANTACVTGVSTKFTAMSTDEPDMAQIVARSTGALKRAAVENEWSLILCS